MEKLVEGQKLWWVPLRSRHEQQCEVTVTKVGRKWAELSNHHRIDLVTLIADSGGFSSPGRCYRSRETYEQAHARDEAWSKLKIDLGHNRCPDGVTEANIIEARRLLGLG